MSHVTSQQIRRIIIDRSHSAQVGHIGCALSVADILGVLYGGVLNVTEPEDPNRDRFVMSKGHAALALYAALYLRGWLSEEQLCTYCEDGSMLGVHPEHELRGVDFSTGSLGMGLGFATGAALAARLDGSTRRVFALLSDGECNEGAVWEAAMFAGHNRLSNLCAIVDWNGQQAFGYSRDVMDQSRLVERWSSFGWQAVEVDGHDPDALAWALRPGGSQSGAPLAVLARTTFGKGVEFMEGQIK